MTRPVAELPGFEGCTDQAGGAAIGARLRRISERIDRDAARVYADAGVRFEQRWFGVINLLAMRGALTVGELAGYLGVSHASVSQVRGALSRAGLIIAEPDAEDGRLRRLRLSAEGARLVETLTPIWRALITAAAGINDEAQDALAALDRLEGVLTRESLYQRIRRILHGAD